MLENILQPSIVGELPHLSEDGLLKLYNYYYFDFSRYPTGASYNVAEHGGDNYYQVA